MTSSNRIVRSPREQMLAAEVELIGYERLGQPIPKGLRERANGDMAVEIDDTSFEDLDDPRRRTWPPLRGEQWWYRLAIKLGWPAPRGLFGG